MKAFVALVLLGSIAHAADLAAVDRKIAKEPVYKAPEQSYGLLVLGEDLQRRIWLVVDGDRLFVDLNGNGDITEAAEEIAASSTGSQGDFVRTWREWRLPKLPGSDRYSDIKVRFSLLNPSWRPDPWSRNGVHMERFMEGVAKAPQANLTSVFVTIAGSRTQLANAMFGMTPAAAPVLHMDAPLTIGVIETVVPHILGRTPDQERIRVAVGTPGQGGDQPGCFSYLMYNVLPDAPRPILEIEFPGADGKRLPVRRYPLDEKC